MVLVHATKRQKVLLKISSVLCFLLLAYTGGNERDDIILFAPNPGRTPFTVRSLQLYWPNTQFARASVNPPN